METARILTTRFDYVRFFLTDVRSVVSGTLKKYITEFSLVIKTIGPSNSFRAL